jgi:hypothetical protein
VPDSKGRPIHDSHWADSPGLLDALVDEVLKTHAETRFLLFIDQVEAMLVSGVDAEDRARFVRILEQASGRFGDRLKIIVALRSDAKRRFAEMMGALSSARGTTFEMAPMTPDELRRTVQGPAERVGLAFEPGLVDRIVADLEGGPSSLGLGQQLMTTLWEKRRTGWLTHAAYEALGGMRGLVAARAEEIYRDLPDAERRMLRSIILRLVRLGQGNESTRRRVPGRALLPATNDQMREDDDHNRSLGISIDAGLLVATEENEEPAVEAAHEALVRSWPRLQQWLEEERDFLEWRERLMASIVDWRAAGQSPDLVLRGTALTEAENQLRDRTADLSNEEAGYIRVSVEVRQAEAAARERRRRWLTVATGIVALWSLVLAVFALWKWRVADVQRRFAEQSYEAASNQFNLAETQ